MITSAQVICGVIVKRRIGGINANAESQSTAVRIRLPGDGVSMRLPLSYFWLCTSLRRTNVATEAAGLARG